MNAILCTRPSHKNDSLITDLEALGLLIYAVPTVRVQFAESKELKELTDNINSYDWILFTSSAGVDALFRYAPKIDPHGPRFAVVGDTTASALQSHGIRADLIPKQRNAINLGKE